jgi:hypothetical protein
MITSEPGPPEGRSLSPDPAELRPQDSEGRAAPCRCQTITAQPTPEAGSGSQPGPVSGSVTHWQSEYGPLTGSESVPSPGPSQVVLTVTVT